MSNALRKFVIPFSVLFSGSVLASDSFKLTSSEISEGKFMGKAQEFQGFACSGGNVLPQFSWSGAPAGTEAFAILAYDPNAPTGSGW